MTVRRLAPDDVEGVERTAHLLDEPPDPAAAGSYLADGRNVFLVAEEKGRVVGFLRGTALGQLKSPRRQMFLYEIEVEAGYRRRGIGGELIRWLLTYCRTNGFEEMFVFTDPSNAPAVRLYQSTGGVTETPADRMYVYQLDRLPSGPDGDPSG